jgi:hypothetical protein
MELLSHYSGAEQVIGMLTLGPTFAPIVARALGLNSYISLGYSRKF